MRSRECYCDVFATGSVEMENFHSSKAPWGHGEPTISVVISDAKFLTFLEFLCLTSL